MTKLGFGESAEGDRCGYCAELEIASRGWQERFRAAENDQTMKEPVMTSGDDYKNWTVVEEGKPDLVRLENFGDVTESVAVDIYVGGEVVRRILQPKDRTEGWSQENEDEFRKQARELATTYTDPDADDIILDPDTPNQKSIN